MVINTMHKSITLPYKLSVLAVALAFSGSSIAQQRWQPAVAGPSQAVHGGVGLIQTPTARMSKEGQFSANYSDNDQYRFWSASIQLFPWLESTVRYTDVRTLLYSDDPGFSGDQTYKDKGIDVKFRLWQESQYLPQVALGFRDFGGTGLFESEFLAFSKQLGAFDLHLGLGWGYLGAAGNVKNPFCEVRDSFCARPDGFGGEGGKIDYQNFFKGPASVFGGVAYQTPWQPLRLKLEYDGNNYRNEGAGTLQQDSRWNYAAHYQVNSWDLSVNYQRGNTLGFMLNYQFDLHNITQVKVKPTPRVVPMLSEVASEAEIDRPALFTALYAEAGFVVRDIRIEQAELLVYGNQYAYRDHDEAIERIARILSVYLPEYVTRFRVIEFTGALPMTETVVDAARFKEAVRKDTLDATVRSTYVRQDPSVEAMDSFRRYDPAGFYTGVESFWIQTLGSPEAFYMYQAGLLLSGGYAFNEAYSLNGTLKATLFDNFDKFNYTVDSLDTPLPRVRTLVREYVTGNKITVDSLYGRWSNTLTPQIYGQVYAGYLETMYGGLGAEFLYRPVDSKVAVGFDLNWVRQRSFENNWDFFDYSTLTGHVNVYWQPDFIKNSLLTFNIGKFLAKDVGVNVDFARRFDSGIVVGAYAAITDASAQEYGEGSFTKGFYLSIPFDLFSITPATGRGRLPWIPISRDGGQMLNRPVNLFNVTEARSPFFR